MCAFHLKMCILKNHQGCNDAAINKSIEMDQVKMERLLRMLVFLGGTRRYSLEEIKEKFSISDSTVYRTIDTFHRAGFIIEKQKGTYRLSAACNAAQTLNRLLHFSEEEAYLLYKTINSLEGTTPVKERLASKLNSLYDVRALEKLGDCSREEIVGKLGEAMRNKQQVLLHDYRSSNSETITDRAVEAFAFLEDYSGVWCYDTGSHSCKQFKVARIARVHIAATGWQYARLHNTPFMDAFRMSAPAPIAIVKASLSLKACNLITEEFPLAEKCITQVNDHYELNIPVANFNGIGRFVMGLPGQIEIAEPIELKNFIKKQAEKISTPTR